MHLFGGLGENNHILIGATGVGGLFTQDVIKAMSRNNETPVVFALSNSTDRAECTADLCYAWSKGTAVFVSGSPFDPVEYKGRTYHPGQGNNAYIFPGLGLGAIACKAERVTDSMLLIATRVLSKFVSAEDLEKGRLYPPLAKIRDISHRIAVEVAEYTQQENIANRLPRTNYDDLIDELKYEPEYFEYI